MCVCVCVVGYRALATMTVISERESVRGRGNLVYKGLMRFYQRERERERRERERERSQRTVLFVNEAI